ncbi:unnamed protein product [Cladocopium goreaui]|uniref:Ribosomal large subunit pseudouridine synthase C (23S rRNA pseudouridine(955/2504/2580) synthase) (rRNA pseudouridylate synthase C) (rRNA-uridine isomerase C) n=1 Tax=Cladocopium goreaui TaxID=2562237 RepID=A0A9P1C0F0_9DINO|nr:unnamed protein product [Cladocopium goreaui]
MPPRLDFPISTAHDIPKEAWYHLQLQLVTGTLLREYLVLAHGLAPGRPEISAYIRWNEDAVASGTFGKPSKTLLHVVGHVTQGPRSFSMLVIRIVTGRKHQIRSHLAWWGHPSVCDGKYATRRTLTEDFGLCRRNFLHRCHLSFVDTGGDGPHHVWQPLAADLAISLGEMRAIGKNQAAKVAWCHGTPPLHEFMAQFWAEKELHLPFRGGDTE